MPYKKTITERPDREMRSSKVESVRVLDSVEIHWISVNVATVKKTAIPYWLKFSEFLLNLRYSPWFNFIVGVYLRRFLHIFFIFI